MFTGLFFCITIATVVMADFHSRKYQKLLEIAIVSKIFHVIDERFSYPFGAKKTVTDRLVNAVHYRSTPDRLKQSVRLEALKESHGGT